MEFLLQTVVLMLALSTTAVLGLPGGAPVDACDNGLMPNHANPANTATGPVPFNVNTRDIGSYYVPDDTYEIVLSGTAQNSNFRGFIIQAQRVADDSPVGQFMNGNNYQPRCMDNTAATHTNGNDKTMVTLTWIAPSNNTGAIRFRYAFVDRYSAGSINVFWAGQLTPMITEAEEGQVRTDPPPTETTDPPPTETTGGAAGPVAGTMLILLLSVIILLIN